MVLWGAERSVLTMCRDPLRTLKVVCMSLRLEQVEIDAARRSTSQRSDCVCVDSYIVRGASRAMSNGAGTHTGVVSSLLFCSPSLFLCFPTALPPWVCSSGRLGNINNRLPLAQITTAAYDLEGAQLCHSPNYPPTMIPLWTRPDGTPTTR